MGWLVLAVWGTVTFLVGYTWYSLLRSFNKSAVALDLGESLFVITLLGSLITGWVAFTLLQLGIYSFLHLGLALTAVILLGIIGLRFTRTPLLPLPKPAAKDGLVLALLVMAALLFFWPAEYILGGADASVYLDLGAIWSRAGSFTFSEPLLADLPPALLPGLFREMPPGHPMQYLRFPGFYMNAAAPDRIVPQFYPLHPVWLTLAHGLSGLRGSLYVTPLWAVLGVWAVYMTFKRLCGAKVGLIGAFFLMLTPLQIYFARYPTAEPLTQYLTWAGLFAFVMYGIEGGALWGFLSGCALGQIFLARIDALPMLLIPGLWLLYTLRRGSWRESFWFFAPLALLLLQTVVQGLGPSYPYAWEVYGSVWRMLVFLFRDSLWLVVLAVCVALFILCGVWRSPAVGGRLVRVAKWMGALGILTAGIYAYFILPRTGTLQEAPYWYGGGTIPLLNHLNLVRLGWYLSPLGIGLGVVGLSAIVVGVDWRRAWSVLGVGLSFTFIYVQNILNNPFHIYAMRRYVPVVLPFLVLGIVYGLSRLWQWRERERKVARAVVVVLGVMLVGWLGYNNRAIWNLIEFRGLTTQLDSIAQRLEPNAILLFDDAATTGAGVTIGAPLQYLFGFTAFDLQEEKLDRMALLAAIDHWQRNNRPIYWVEGPSPVIGMPPEAEFIPDFGVWIDVLYLEQSYFHFPTARLDYRVPLEFYKLTANPVCTLPTQLDIGTLDATYLQSGFYQKEWLGGRSFRWTDGVGVVTLPCLPDDVPDTLRLTLTALAIRATDVTPVTIALSLNSFSLGQWTLASDIMDINILVPGDLLRGAEQVLEIRSDTWIPADNNVGEDDRQLGVLVDSIVLSAGVPDD